MHETVETAATGVDADKATGSRRNLRKAVPKGSTAPMIPKCVRELDTNDVGNSGDRQALFQRLVGDGCDAILLAGPGVPTPFEREPRDPSFVELVAAAGSAGLAVFIEIPLNGVPADSPMVAEHPEWLSPMVAASSAALDPRRDASSSAKMQLLASSAQRSAIVSDVVAALDALSHSGVSGFRLVSSPRQAPLERALIDELQSRCTFIAVADAHAELNWHVSRVHDAVVVLARPDGAGAGMTAVLTAAMSADGVLLPADFAVDATSSDGALIRLLKLLPSGLRATEIRTLNLPGASLVARLRIGKATPGGGRRAILALIQRGEAPAEFIDPAVWLARSGSFRTFAPLPASQDEAMQLKNATSLGPGEVRLFEASEAVLPVMPKSSRTVDTSAALKAPRITIKNLQPSVDDGRYPAKRTIGDRVVVEVDAFADGHDVLALRLLWRSVGTTKWQESPMRSVGNDRFRGSFALPEIGRYEFTAEAWRDAWATFRSELGKKHAAGQRVSVEVEEGRHLLQSAAAQARKPLAAPVLALLKKLEAADEGSRIDQMLDAATAAAMAAVDDRPFAVRYDRVAAVDAERNAAGFSAWYEIFPRSMSGDPRRHGTFDDVIAQLPRIRDMGFDVLYMPPIHPIGLKNRKGPNNTLTPGPDDVGSPYAIGSKEGGHDAIHPRLGTIDDFHRLRDAAAAQGLELALDFAIQCSPDHPWLQEYPEWFAWRADGTIKYAENPPKKYEDIVNVDFYGDGAKPSLWHALRDVIEYWVQQGVNIFRVDNPHTKPMPFWEWLIADIRGRHPDVIFLAEAFTRPGPMQQLAKVGYSQSYTYFTWRDTKEELVEYLTELTATPMREYFRPHFFVNTPDINPPFLQRSGRPGHLIRAALAATMSGLWGVYSGFELCEASGLPGREEYLDSEKYQIRAWDWDRPGNITREITQLNRIRRENPALHSHFGIEFFFAGNDQVLWYEKATASRDNVLLIAVSVDPFNAQEARVELPLWRWQLPDDAALDAEDLLDGSLFTWRGKNQTVRLDPLKPYSIWRVRPSTGA